MQRTYYVKKQITKSMGNIQKNLAIGVKRNIWNGRQKEKQAMGDLKKTIGDC